MKTHRPPRRALPAVFLLALAGGIAEAVPVGIIAEADLEVSENLVGDVTADGVSPADAPFLNARFSGIDRNEVIALRFNLSGFDRSEIQGAGVRLVNYRANPASQTLRIYGVNQGATGFNAVTATEGAATDNDWPEDGTTFSTMPGLEFDADSTTQGIRFDRTVDLGTADANITAEGSVVMISSSFLKDFIVDHDDDIVTILVVSDTVDDSQKRFASREATVLESGGEEQPAGTFAPRLVIDLPGIPIPSQADLQINEQGDSSSGASQPSVNARFSSTDRNEVIALRFDLSGFSPSDITHADVSLINFRNNTGNATLRFYGVMNGVTGYDVVTDTEGPYTDNDWPEGGATRFSTMPGLEHDGDLTTRGVRLDRTEDLGAVDMAPSIGNILKGSKVTFASDQLVEFLKNHPDNLVTILVVSDLVGTGQKRFATKEALILDGDSVPQPPGTYAPTINLLLGNPDSDGDGLPDFWEILVGLDPNNPDENNNSIPDGQDDFDNDGLTNLEEFERGTDPLNPDSDGDGLSDLVETGTGIWNGLDDTGTSPLLVDSDGDGLPDNIENPDLPYLDELQTGTDPNLRDSDFDLYSDGAEIARGTDPTDLVSVPDGAILELLGQGPGALLGGPLTDPENDIDDSTPEGANFNWAAVTSTPAKNFFGTGSLGVDPQNMSGAFDLFDGRVGNLNDKWLSGGVAAGASVTVEFPGTVSLESFTIASADDRPERDPVDWQILGSNDGVEFTPIFTQFDPAGLTLWTSRFQGIKCSLAAPTPQYRYIRFVCTRVGVEENQVHVNEIEYFGVLTPDEPSGDFRITGFVGSPTSPEITLTWTSAPGEIYRIGYSASLVDGFAGTAASDVQASGGATTTHTFPNPEQGQQRLFFQVEKP